MKSDNLCPRCGAEPTRTLTSYGLRLTHCDVWAWGEHPLVDAETHEARKAAHAAFDPIWREGLVSRSAAYRWLAQQMGLTAEECHMKKMTAKQARRIPALAHLFMHGELPESGNADR